MEEANNGHNVSDRQAKDSNFHGEKESSNEKNRSLSKTNQPQQLQQECHREEGHGIFFNTMFTETQTQLMTPHHKQGTTSVIQHSNQSTMTPTTENNQISFVKFRINNEVYATAFKLTTTIGEIKRCLADVLDLEEDIIKLERNSSDVEISHTLFDLGARPYCKITFELTSTNGEKGRAMIIEKAKKNFPTLDVITVHLGQDGDFKDIVVEIETQCCQKEWLGGNRNMLTNKKYHHAITQTHPKKKQMFKYTESGEAIPLFYHRDTQTPFKPKQIAVDTDVNKATQMWRLDLYISSKSDKIMTASTYQNYDEWYKNNSKMKAILTIQRTIRNWIRGRKILQLISLQKALLEDMKRQKAQILQEQANKEREIITGAAYPVKRDDFYMLYLMVDNWWKREWKRICDLRSEEPKKAESILLLEKEVKLIQDIEKHRNKVKNEALKKERIRFLDQTSRPLVFKNSRGQMTSIDDIETQRAREFKEIYSLLINKNMPATDRMDVLFTLKQLFVLHYMNYEYSRDIISLIEREIDLLVMGTKMKDLIGLQKRIEQLYMNFLQQKEFNPKAAKYKKPNLPKTIDLMFQCTHCRKLLPASSFPVHVRMKSYSECKSCVWLQNIGHQRVDMSPYLKMLKSVQNTEMEKCCYSAVCFILQPIGMGYLTKVIWHGHSAISECQDLSKLQHIRWLPEVEWAPWNTILLTDQEAKCHASIPDVFEFYDKKFIEAVRQKHILARRLFISLCKMDYDIRSSGVWSSVTDSGPYLHPSHQEVYAKDNDYDKI